MTERLLYGKKLKVCLCVLWYSSRLGSSCLYSFSAICQVDDKVCHQLESADGLRIFCLFSLFSSPELAFQPPPASRNSRARLPLFQALQKRGRWVRCEGLRPRGRRRRGNLLLRPSEPVLRPWQGSRHALLCRSVKEPYGRQPCIAGNKCFRCLGHSDYSARIACSRNHNCRSARRAVKVSLRNNPYLYILAGAYGAREW